MNFLALECTNYMVVLIAVDKLGVIRKIFLVSFSKIKAIIMSSWLKSYFQLWVKLSFQDLFYYSSVY